MGKKLMKSEEKEENCLTKLSNLKSGFICQHKKTILKIEFQKFNLRLSISGHSINPPFLLGRQHSVPSFEKGGI